MPSVVVSRLIPSFDSEQGHPLSDVTSLLLPFYVPSDAEAGSSSPVAALRFVHYSSLCPSLIKVLVPPATSPTAYSRSPAPKRS